jgi:hemoglobin/transferrin/lactoferrin receptor protein
MRDKAIIHSLGGVLVCLMAALSVHAQQTKKDSVFKELNEVVISAQKFPEKKKNIVQRIDLITSKYISLANTQNTGDLLMNTGNIFVQKSQQGGSSPVIRGFEASRVLLVVDGVRLNNLIYRSGHLQNVITVDQNMLEAVEVMYGPSSAQYGSDALGGAVHFRTKQPVLADDSNTFVIKGNYFTRYSHVNHEKTLHADVNMGGKKWGWLQSYSFSDFGDMRMGAVDNPNYPGFGKRDSLIVPINGEDSIIRNENPLLQKFSGYQQWDMLQKILYQPSKNISHLVNIQLSNSSNVPRYDRLQDKRDFGGIIGRTLRWAEWYYGPQLRWLAAYELNVKNKAGFDQIRANINYQWIEESRYQREYRRYDRLDGRVENVQVAGWTLDARKIGRRHEWTIGTDGQYGMVKSTAERKNILTGDRTRLDTRYPDGLNQQWNAAVYSQHIFKINHKWIWNDGVRFQFNHLRSTIQDNSFFNLPYTEIIQQHEALTGNVGLIYLPNAGTKLSLNVSAGFRAPNVDDLAKIFESNTDRQQLVVPNPDIRPERTYNAELGVNHSFGGKFNINGNLFYTLFRQALVKSPYAFNGQDSFLYNGIMSQTLASVNAGRAQLHGFSLELKYTPTAYITAYGSLNYTKGRFLTNPNTASTIYQKKADGTGYELVQKKVTSKPLDHIPPLFGKFQVIYQRSVYRGEFFVLWNAAKSLKEYNPDGEDNAQYATPEGTFVWYTLNMRMSADLFKRFTIQAAIENISDIAYRPFASGLSGPGRNFQLTLRYSH